MGHSTPNCWNCLSPPLSTSQSSPHSTTLLSCSSFRRIITSFSFAFSTYSLRHSNRVLSPLSKPRQTAQSRSAFSQFSWLFSKSQALAVIPKSREKVILASICFKTYEISGQSEPLIWMRRHGIWIWQWRVISPWILSCCNLSRDWS